MASDSPTLNKGAPPGYIRMVRKPVTSSRSYTLSGVQSRQGTLGTRSDLSAAFLTISTLTKGLVANKLSSRLSPFMEATMQQVNIHEAKTNLSRLIEKAVKGESFVIAKSGKPMVTVSAYTPPPDPAKRLGFLKGRLEVPEDFDSMGSEEIQAMFEGAE